MTNTPDTDNTIRRVPNGTIQVSQSPDTEDGVCNDDCRYTDGLCDRHGTGNTPDTYESMDGGGYAPSKGVGAKIQSCYTSQNTPDTEVELRKEVREMFKEYLAKHDEGYDISFVPDVLVDKVTTSRDTYWKERVRPLRRIIRRMDRELKDYEAIALYDIYAMSFYDDTGIWPPGKSAPMEMHHEFDQAERSKKYTEWHQALDTLLDNLK